MLQLRELQARVLQLRALQARVLQLRELQLLHCDQVQGFLLGRPDDAVSVPGLVDASNDDLFAAGGVIKR